MQGFTRQLVKLSWIGGSPQSGKKVALLIPQFNECSNAGFMLRLSYFKKLADDFHDVMDVILVDDGSTDNSLHEIRSFVEENESHLIVLSVSPNMNKVGALYKTALSINHEFVILSDFDTDLIGLEALSNGLELMRSNPQVMGCYFRMLPYEGSGGVFLFQQLEYSMSRACYKFYRKENSVPVMPGAGCCYKRELLLTIYARHSGLRSGEDREATLIGLKLGYKTFYYPSITSLTRPPLSFRALVKQRIRWNMGYIETASKEGAFYQREIQRLSVLGVRTLADIIRVVMFLLSPLIIPIGLFYGWQVLAVLVGVTYCASVIWPLNAFLVSPGEFVELKGKKLRSILCYPLYKIPLECITWFRAISTFITNTRGSDRRVQKQQAFPYTETITPAPIGSDQQDNT